MKGMSREEKGGGLKVGRTSSCGERGLLKGENFDPSRDDRGGEKRSNGAVPAMLEKICIR